MHWYVDINNLKARCCLLMTSCSRPVSFQPSDEKQPRDAEGRILLDDTDFTVTYAVRIDEYIVETKETNINKFFLK